MARSSQSGAGSSSAASLLARRDADGFLPLVKCTRCGTQLVGRVSQKETSLGKRFYKCPKLEHTPMACKFCMFEEQYIEYLATYGVEQANIGRQGCNEMLNQSNDLLTSAIDVIERCNVELQRARGALKEAECAVKDADASKIAMGAKLERIGERLVLVGLANIFLVVLVLMVLLVK